MCASEGSLHGTTFASMLEQVDMVESRGGGVLNPLAPEFVPRGPSSPAPSHRLPASLPRVTVRAFLSRASTFTKQEHKNGLS